MALERHGRVGHGVGEREQRQFAPYAAPPRADGPRHGDRGASIVLQAPPRPAHAPWTGTVSLLDVDDGMRAALAAIVMDFGVMQWVGNGRAWTDAQLDRFLRYCREDKQLSDAERSHFYWAILCAADAAAASAFDAAAAASAKPVGLVGIHTMPVDLARLAGAACSEPAATGSPPPFYVTIMLSAAYQGRGIGKRALALALQEFRRRRGDVTVMIADYRANNHASQRLLWSVGFTDSGSYAYRGCTYARMRCAGSAQPSTPTIGSAAATVAATDDGGRASPDAGP